jgi:uncharacterized protein (TIGR01619 family)
LKIPRIYAKLATTACLSLLHASPSKAQTEKGDWDTYVTRPSGGKPVSTVVDLSLAERAPMRDKGYAVLVRTALLSADAEGMPTRQESESLHLLEDLLERTMAESCRAVYAGRFTHKGIRQFVFYASDTASYRKTVASAFTASPGHAWNARAVADTGWSNYFDLLYPTPVELERIRNRRLVDLLSDKGDDLTSPRRVDHFFRFRSKSSRESFLRGLSMEGFEIAAMPEADGDGSHPYALQLHRKDSPDYPMVDRVVIPLWQKAQKSNGRYEGWETYLVNRP